MEKNEEKLIDIKFYNWENFTEYENELWTNEERKTKEVIEKYENSKKANEEKIKLKETLEENKEKSQEIKMMKEYLEKK